MTFSDVDEAAVQLAASNARLNGFRDFETAAIDLRAAPTRQFPVILAADVCYEVRLTEAVAEFIEKGLAPGGVALVADAERYSAKSFRSLIERRGMKLEVTDLKVAGNGETCKGQIYRIGHSG